MRIRRCLLEIEPSGVSDPSCGDSSLRGDCQAGSKPFLGPPFAWEQVVTHTHTHTHWGTNTCTNAELLTHTHMQARTLTYTRTHDQHMYTNAGAITHTQALIQYSTQSHTVCAHAHTYTHKLLTFNLHSHLHQSQWEHTSQLTLFQAHIWRISSLVTSVLWEEGSVKYMLWPGDKSLTWKVLSFRPN